MRKYYENLANIMGRALSSLDIRNRKIYGNYLAQTYYYVSHSTRMLAFAAGLMKRHDEPQFRRFVKHISEETAHDCLAEKDLEDLDMSPSDFAQLPETRTLWEPQYYKIQHEGPLTLMGYIIALESFASIHLPSFYAQVKSEYSGRACRFIKLHAEEDSEHLNKAIQLLSTLPADVSEAVWMNSLQTAKAYSGMVSACSNFTSKGFQ